MPASTSRPSTSPRSPCPSSTNPSTPPPATTPHGAPVAGVLFFDLESIEDPRELLARATELRLAFRAAQERAVEFQALAAAQLADPRRFDRLSPALIAEQAEWTEDYARKMIEFGETLQRGTGTDPA
ncbi:hypothetical protein ACFXEL_29870 [Streptomyces sp. NPDC059382]|uniref:hypothetical protein n=1 Tax=Streptomyces sp. NPDC059382 TaxID=3346816 RepID=UPI0036AC7137